MGMEHFAPQEVTFTQANGDKYVGQFRYDGKNGQGIETLANGDKYVYLFLNDSVKKQVFIIVVLPISNSVHKISISYDRST